MYCYDCCYNLLLLWLLTRSLSKLIIASSQFNTSVVGVLCDVDGVDSVAYAVLLDVFRIKTYHPDTDDLMSQEEVVLVGYLEGKSSYCIYNINVEIPVGYRTFPVYKPTIRQEGCTGIPGTWWIELVYADALCGLAQMIKDPCGKDNKDHPLDDRYLSLPSPTGSFTVDQEPLRMPEPSPRELGLLTMAEELAAEDD